MMGLYMLTYVIEIVNASTGKSTKENRKYITDKIEDIIREYRNLRNKWHISNIELYSGKLEKKPLETIIDLL